jgi:hypothetical protein
MSTSMQAGEGHDTLFLDVEDSKSRFRNSAKLIPVTASAVGFRIEKAGVFFWDIKRGVSPVCALMSSLQSLARGSAMPVQHLPSWPGSASSEWMATGSSWAGPVMRCRSHTDENLRFRSHAAVCVEKEGLPCRRVYTMHQRAHLYQRCSCQLSLRAGCAQSLGSP